MTPFAGITLSPEQEKLKKKTDQQVGKFMFRLSEALAEAAPRYQLQVVSDACVPAPLVSPGINHSGQPYPEPEQLVLFVWVKFKKVGAGVTASDINYVAGDIITQLFDTPGMRKRLRKPTAVPRDGFDYTPGGAKVPGDLEARFLDLQINCEWFLKYAKEWPDAPAPDWRPDFVIAEDFYAGLGRTGESYAPPDPVDRWTPAEIARLTSREVGYMELEDAMTRGFHCGGCHYATPLPGREPWHSGNCGHPKVRAPVSAEHGCCNLFKPADTAQVFPFAGAAPGSTCDVVGLDCSPAEAPRLGAGPPKDTVPVAQLIGEQVEVYRNLHNGLWSVKVQGRVRAYAEQLCLKDAKFVVQEGGRQRVLKEKRKAVHAWVKGTLASGQSTLIPGGECITYNPYTAGHFFQCGSPKSALMGADTVCFDIHATPKVVASGLQIRPMVSGLGDCCGSVPEEFDFDSGYEDGSPAFGDTSSLEQAAIRQAVVARVRKYLDDADDQEIHVGKVVDPQFAYHVWFDITYNGGEVDYASLETDLQQVAADAYALLGETGDEDVYQLAGEMDFTPAEVERLVTAQNPDWRPAEVISEDFYAGTKTHEDPQGLRDVIEASLDATVAWTGDGGAGVQVFTLDVRGKNEREVRQCELRLLEADAALGAVVYSKVEEQGGGGFFMVLGVNRAQMGDLARNLTR